MLTQSQKRKQEGFTIIEVLIVLAIAGLIMLIVFLAVPALQRNSRNTQRKNDVSALLGAVSEYANNNAGKLPTAVGDFNSNVKLGFYETGDVTYPAFAANAAATGIDKVQIMKAAKCGSTPTDAPVAGSSRQFVAWYQVEGGSGAVSQCQEG